MNKQIKSVKIPDPILAQPKNISMTIKNKILLVFLLGFLIGWVWMTSSFYFEPILGLDGLSFWRLLLPI